MTELVVEDGSGLADSDAFMSVDYMDTYAVKNDLTDWLDGVGDAEAAIRRATLCLSSAWSYKGFKTRGRAQAQAFPRSEVEDEEGNTVPDDEVPNEIIIACCELAAYERANPGSLTPAFIATQNSIRREKIDVLEIEYTTPALSATSLRPVLTVVEDIISGLVEGTTADLQGIATRV